MGSREDHAKKILMTPEERLSEVERQVRAVRTGDLTEITCPYCGLGVKMDGVFCCQTLVTAIDAVLERLQVNEAIEFIDRVTDNASRN